MKQFNILFLLIINILINLVQIQACDICKIDELVVVQENDKEQEEIHHDLKAHFNYVINLINEDKLEMAYSNTLTIISLMNTSDEDITGQIIELLLLTLPYSQEQLQKNFIEQIIKLAVYNGKFSKLAYKFIKDSNNINNFAIYVIKLLEIKKTDEAFQELTNFVESKKAAKEPIDPIIIQLLLQFPKANFFIAQFLIDEVISLYNSGDEDAKHFLTKNKELHLTRLIQTNKKQEAFKELLIEFNNKKNSGYSLNVLYLFELLPYSKAFIKENCTQVAIQLALNGFKEAYEFALSNLEQEILIGALNEDPFAYEFVIRHDDFWMKHIHNLINTGNLDKAFNESINLMQTSKKITKKQLLELFLKILPQSKDIIKKNFIKDLIHLAQSGNKSAKKFLQQNLDIPLSKAAIRKIR